MDSLGDGQHPELDEDELELIECEVQYLRSGLARYVYVKGMVTVETGEYL